jgi:mono/diheme cytochrome c family protein
MECHNQNQSDLTTGPRRSVVTDMETATSHHIYNTTALADSSCEVCHLRTTHTREGDPSVRLLNGDTGEAILYNGTGASATPACVSCHDADGVSRLGQNAKQPFFESGDFNEPVDVGWQIGVSAHDLAANLQTDKCFGCHGNSAGSDTDTLNPASSAHGSSEPKMLRYAYDTATPQNFCYSCHNGTGANADIQTQFGLSYNHSAGNQKCTNCHEVHQAESGKHTPGQVISNVTKMPGRDYEYQICFNYVGGTPTGCHSATVNKTDNSSETFADATFGGPANHYQTNWDNPSFSVMSQFSTSNYAYHPVMGQGRNQPAGTENTAWTSNTARRATGSGLDHTFTDGWSQTSMVICSDCHGNSATAPVGPHGSSFPWILKGPDPDVTVTIVGPTVRYPNRDDGTATGAAITSTTLKTTQRNLCVNCHRGDVYLWGGNGAAPQGGLSDGQNLSTYGHAAGSNDCFKIAADNSGSGGFLFTACLNCHGGGEVLGIHGSNMGIGTDKNDAAYGDEMGKRFMNGGAWRAHDGVNNGDTSSGCYTGAPPTSSYGPGVAMSDCGTAHKPRGVTLNYIYDWE